jgi:hypothetical protein
MQEPYIRNATDVKYRGQNSTPETAGTPRSNGEIYPWYVFYKATTGNDSHGNNMCTM